MSETRLPFCSSVWIFDSSLWCFNVTEPLNHSKNDALAVVIWNFHGTLVQKSPLVSVFRVPPVQQHVAATAAKPRAPI